MSDATTTLISQGESSVQALSLMANDAIPTTLSAVVWNPGHAIPLSAGLNWDPGQYTGFEASDGSTVVGLDPGVSGTSAIQVAPDGSEVGILINSSDFINAGHGTGPMPIVLEQQFDGSFHPFARGGTALSTSLDLQVPYVSGGMDQIVLYMELRDNISGRTFAYGLNLFSNTGAPSNGGVYSSIDPGTGCVIVTSTAGEASPYASSTAGTAPFQSGTWTGFQHFDFTMTAANLAAAIQLGNASIDSNFLSTDVSNYSLMNVSLDSELAYVISGGSFAYAEKNLTVGSTDAASGATGDDAAGDSAACCVVVQAGQSINTATGAETTVQMGAGSETVASCGNDTVSLGSGAGTVLGLGSAVSVTGGSGSFYFSGGSGAATVNAGSSGQDTIKAGTGTTLIEGGTGGESILVASGGMTSIIAGVPMIRCSAPRTPPFKLAQRGGDVLVGSGAALLIGDAGAQLWAGGDQNETLRGGAGNETLCGGTCSGSTLLQGGSGADLIVTSSYSNRNTVQCGTGPETVMTGSWDTSVQGSTGTAFIVNSGQNTTCTGGAGDTTLFSTGGGVSVAQGSGNLLGVLVGDMGDQLQIGSGNSTLFAYCDNVHLLFAAGQDTTADIMGFNSSDQLSFAPGGSVQSEDVYSGVTVLTLNDGSQINLFGFSDTAMTLSRP